MEEYFWDRKQELGHLKQSYTSLRTSIFIAMYGRRRVGKTELIRKFLGALNTPKLYVYVDLAEKSEILNSFSKEVFDQLGQTIKFNDWNEFLDFIAEKAAKEKFILVIDEFQRFVQTSPEFISRLQKYWDTSLKNKKLMLLLVGSSIGMMHRVIGSHTGALYGRSTEKWKISPFKFAEFREMFKKLPEEEKIIYYSVFGGTPYYLNLAQKKNEQGIFDAINILMLNKASILFEEPKNLLEVENVRTHARYNSILSSIAEGKDTLKEISDFTGILPTTLPAYIHRLDALLDLVKTREPLFGKKKLGKYAIKDNFFRFWYKFIYPNQSAINLNNRKLVEGVIRSNINAYTGLIFEEIIEELLIMHQNKKIKGHDISFDKIGGWWDRNGNEIDIVASNSKGRKLLVGEVKWTNEKAGAGVLENLVKKAKMINASGEYTFMIVSKSGFTEECLKKMKEINALSLDLKEVAALFENAGKGALYGS
ncbi:MAG: ATP-binding protein [Nanoarchaeota archaeon]|nr:ATP-binding protein [Nanoarchaeota archaeon]